MSFAFETFLHSLLFLQKKFQRHLSSLFSSEETVPWELILVLWLTSSLSKQSTSISFLFWICINKEKVCRRNPFFRKTQGKNFIVGATKKMCTFFCNWKILEKALLEKVSQNNGGCLRWLNFMGIGKVSLDWKN